MGMAEQMIDAFNSKMAQKIINGTDKIDLTPKKYYVYIVYDDAHGKVGIYAKAENATARIWKDMCDYFGMDRNNPYPYDYDGEDRRGWEGCMWWVREEVIQ
jgi:hypothetical protein